MARYRLRFLLQEFDLPPGETLLGRSPECHVTIEDPLVSRQHARVRITGDQAEVEDLGSRNGLRVNGRPVRGPTPLIDGDRIRIGTQELVFCKVSGGSNQPSKRTGFLRHCAQCRTPYPEEMVACPSCGSTDRTDEDTLSGLFSDSRHNWTVQLLVEVIEKALSLHRDGDAERILRRAAGNIDERIVSGQPVDKRQLDALADCASRVAVKQQSTVWAKWILVVYNQVQLVPPETVVGRMAGLPVGERSRLREVVGDLARTIRKLSGMMTDADLAGFTRLEAFERELES